MLRNQKKTVVLLLAGAGLIHAGSIGITPTNSPYPSYAYLGGIVGPADTSDNLATGSYNYVILTGTNFLAAGTAPTAGANAYSSSQDFETSFWQIDGSDNLTAQWINTDTSAPNTLVWWLPGASALLLVGDGATFNSNFPGGMQVSLVYHSLGADGYIEAIDTNTSADLGAISDQSNSNHHIVLTSNPANRLLINDISSSPTTPEPSSALLLAAGIGILAAAHKLRTAAAK